MTTELSFEYQRMTTTQSAVQTAAASIRASGRRLPNVVLSSHLEAKLSAWTIMLRDAGFGVCVSPSNPASTVPEEEQRLRYEEILVLPRDPGTRPPEDFWADLAKFGPDLVLDDGALLIQACNRRDDAAGITGAVEFTTSGHDSLGGGGDPPQFPVIDVGVSYCKYELGNVYGTGMSALVAISMAANVHLAAKRVLVIGYGAVGRSVAHAARSLGAAVLVSDNRLRNMARAHFDGHRTGTVEELVTSADVVLTCSGSAAALPAAIMSALPDNSIVANVGCFANELDVDGLRALAEHTVRRERQIETFGLPGAKHVHVLANGELINLAVGRGWPIELIDICFALSTLCFSEVWLGDLPPGLLPVSPSLDEAALALFFESR